MNVREAAYSALCSIVIDKKYSNLVLQNDYRLNSQDRSLLTQIVYGTLRNYRLVRYQWADLVEKKVNSRIAVLLDSAVYQLLFLDRIPAYAVINETVEIAKKIKAGSYASLVNAVLRKISETEKRHSDNPAVEYSLPDWLIKMWNSHYGNETCQKICESFLKDGRVALRVNTLLTSEKQLLEDEHFSKGIIENCIYYDGNILDSDYYRNSMVMIQNESSQIPVSKLNPYGNVLDMCAAPGSKTIQMAMMMNNTGSISSIDLYPKRVELIESNLKRYGIVNTKTFACDSRQLNEIFDSESFDCILLDAPCSGLGTVRHKPDIRTNITPESIDEIVQLQKQLLDTASTLLKKGGTLVYSTCTLNRKENERQTASFLKNHPDFTLLEERTIFPFEFDSDGFYYGKMTKV